MRDSYPLFLIDILFQSMSFISAKVLA